MSIVERALQKARKQAKQDSATDADLPGDPAQSGLAPREPDVAPPAGAPFAAREPPADASLTARDMKVIIEIDENRLRKQGRLPDVQMAAQANDEMRRIKWPILNAIAGREGPPLRNNVVLVTSAVPGEGKTFTSLNLALSIVRDRASKVILVDADVARPGLTPSLGVERWFGLNDVLDDPARDISEATYRTTVEGLLFVPAGKWHEHAPELFAGAQMERVIADLASRTSEGVIILDSPPLLATNEAQAVTRLVGQVLLVVRADSTEARAVTEALALVDKSTPVNAVLNCLEASLINRYYGNYYYSYGSGYGRGRRTGKGDA